MKNLHLENKFSTNITLFYEIFDVQIFFNFSLSVTFGERTTKYACEWEIKYKKGKTKFINII